MDQPFGRGLWTSWYGIPGQGQQSLVPRLRSPDQLGRRAPCQAGLEGYSRRFYPTLWGYGSISTPGLSWGLRIELALCGSERGIAHQQSDRSTSAILLTAAQEQTLR